MEQSVDLNLFTQTRRVSVSRKERWAWYLYDFGNSAYAAVILLAVYSAYFKQQVVGGAEGTRLWGFSVGIAMLVTAVISPVLGAMADRSGTKKLLLAFFTGMAVIFTSMLFFVDQGDVWTGMLFFILAEIGYRGGQVFYNALLPDIAAPEEMGHISGNGWAFGSFGGIICLLIVLALILSSKGTFIIRLAFPITAAFYGVSSLPLFLFVRQRTKPEQLSSGENYFTVAFRQVSQTWRQAGHYKQFMLFMLAFMIFNCAIMMTLDFAGIIGSVLFRLSQQELIIFMIIVQVTSVLGAFAFGKLVDRLSSKRTLILAIMGMICVVSGIMWVNSLAEFYLLGALAGLTLTGVQSVSRTSVGQLAPEEKSSEFFGIFSLAGQISAFTGPAIYGMVAAAIALARQQSGWEPVLAEQTGMRGAVLAMIGFLAAGLIVLLFVRNWQNPEKTVKP